MIAPEQLAEILKTSPLVFLTLYILWQYRRDYINIFSQSKELSQELIVILKTVVVALESNKAATEENTRIIRSLTGNK